MTIKPVDALGEARKRLIKAVKEHQQFMRHAEMDNVRREWITYSNRFNSSEIHNMAMKAHDIHRGDQVDDEERQRRVLATCRDIALSELKARVSAGLQSHTLRTHTQAYGPKSGGEWTST